MRVMGRVTQGVKVINLREGDWHRVAATRGPEVRRFLSWARFPYFVRHEERGGSVIVGDARYTLEPGGSWASVEVPLGP